MILAGLNQWLICYYQNLRLVQFLNEASFSHSTEYFEYPSFEFEHVGRAGRPLHNLIAVLGWGFDRTSLGAATRCLAAGSRAGARYQSLGG